MRRLIAAAAVVVLGASACDSDTARSGSAGEGRIHVVASFYPVAHAAEKIGGDLVEVVNLTPAGTEPHDLELSPRQVDQLQDADVVLYLGQGFQPAVEEVVRGRKDISVDVLEAVELDEDAPASPDEHDDAHGDQHDDGDDLDPHFWLAPKLMSDAVGWIEEALAGTAPEHAEAFAANAAEYQRALAELDREFDAGLSNCQRRTIVTAHAAFHYLADSYELEQLAIAGLSPESEPDPQRLAELSDVIRERGVTTVFYETLAAPDVAETLAREARVETAVLNPLEGLTAADVKKGKDYMAVMRDNLAALADALGCS